jgi:hypothetical protein
MRFAAFFSILIIATTTVAQNPTPQTPSLEAKSATVPITLDHNRIVIDVDVPLADGSAQRVRAWVDNGDPELTMSQRVAKLMELAIRCEGQNCSAKPPREITIGGLKISLATVKAVNIPGKTNSAASIAFPGMNAEINIPSGVLRNYDVLIDFPERKLTIAQPGGLKFNGVKTKAVVNAENGLIQVPSQIENKKYNLALDVGSSISFLTQDVFEKLAAAHPGWPHMTGAVGPANMWGLQEEAKWKLLRVARLQYGPLFLTNVATVEFPKDRMDFFEKRAGIPTAGLLGSNALINYRIGLDYAHARRSISISADCSTLLTSTLSASSFGLMTTDDLLSSALLITAASLPFRSLKPATSSSPWMASLPLVRRLDKYGRCWEEKREKNAG